jgi:hypothetical protein
MVLVSLSGEKCKHIQRLAVFRDRLMLRKPLCFALRLVCSSGLKISGASSR